MAAPKPTAKAIPKLNAKATPKTAHKSTKSLSAMIPLKVKTNPTIKETTGLEGDQVTCYHD